MTQEERDLLIIDLCSRVFYETIIYIEGDWADDERDYYDCILTLNKLQDFATHDYILKPYLRPMSSITEEERSNLRAYCRTQEGIIYDIGVSGAINSPAIINWLNAHHFDYRGLIEKGLALEAPEGMYKIK